MTKQSLCVICQRIAAHVVKDRVAAGELLSADVLNEYYTLSDFKVDRQTDKTLKMPLCSLCDEPLNTERITEDQLNALYIEGAIDRERFAQMLKSFEEI